MDTELVLIFTDQVAEFTDLQSATPHIDLTDEPVFPSICPIPDLCGNNFFITSSVSLHRYYDIQFMLVNNFWGCQFNFGNSTCGVQVRQGIAHMIDRAKFAASEQSLAGLATALDNPLPPNNGGLLPPNPCAWDASFPQSGSNCIVGSSGGTAYHLANATGADGHVWLSAPGSRDLNAAAQHFVNAGIALGFNSTTSVLTGINAAAGAHPVNFFIRNDDSPRLHLGDSLSAEICYLFTGSYTFPCPPYLSTIHGPISAFPGFQTSTTYMRLSWDMYTGAFSDVFPYDASLYYTYNSRFVSGIPSVQPPNGPCSSASVPSFIAANYMYLCNPNYDNLSSQMEFAPCLSASGDPMRGSVNNAPGANCPFTFQLSSISAGIQTEDAYGKGAYSIPVFDIINAQFAYLSNWQRVINGDGTGIPNFFTWLDAYSPNPDVSGTVRQGFSTTTQSLNPYTAESVHDFYILNNIYDSLSTENPLNHSQLFNWMTISSQQLPNTSLTYTPPSGTISTFRFTLRSDVFFQDGRKVTSFDAAFSYLSMLATGAFQGMGLSSVTGITVLGPLQFDVNVKGFGPFTYFFLTSLPILPGRYWTSAGSGAWDSALNACTMINAPCYLAQYTVGPSSSTGIPSVVCNTTFSCTFPAANMNVNPGQISPSYDPILNHTLVGSGPFQCGTVTSSGSGMCSSSGSMNPPVGGSYTLSRFGKGLTPCSSISSTYFRSNCNLALWTWTGNSGDITHDFLNVSAIFGCFGQIFPSPNCLRWEMGIGGCGGTPNSPCQIGLQQVAIVNRFVGVNWVGPFNWQSLPPSGIVSFAPVLHEGSTTFNPASVAGCSFPYPNSGYDC